MEFVKEVEKKYNNFKKQEDEHIITIINLDEQLKSCRDKTKIKYFRTQLITEQTKYNKEIEESKRKLGNDIIDFLFELQIEENIDILLLYRILSEMGREFSRYVKLPIAWVSLGFIAGLLEDLVVVMRTASQTGISNSHLITLDELVDGYFKYEQENHNFTRFPFLTKLFTQDKNKINDMLTTAIKSQGINCKRVSQYFDESNNTTYYYAIQGLLGSVKFDNRVVKSLTIDSENLPLYAVHFTKKEIAHNIWNKIPTTSARKRTNGLDIVTGAICKFDRPIHALTNIACEKEGDKDKYHIITADKDIRNRMTHGIKQTNVRPKYESGLVIDIKKLVSILPKDAVQINEIGTLLVHTDIPHDCLLDYLYTNEQINYFWNSLD